MSDTRENGGTCGCGTGACGTGPGRWIWIVLIAAIAGVLTAKAIVKKPAPAGVPATAEPSAAVAAPEPAAATKPLPRLLDLGSVGCVPCKMMTPILDELKTTYAGRLDVQFIDVREDTEAGGKYGISLIPTQIFFDAQGKELYRHEGFFSREDILAKWKELGVDLEKQG